MGVKMQPLPHEKQSGESKIRQEIKVGEKRDKMNANVVVVACLAPNGGENIKKHS
jgi:hypothetical protein